MGKHRFKFALAGALAGLANGFFGAGGGMVLVPLYCRWAKLDEHKALATSVAVILPMSIVSAVIYFLRGSFSLTDALPFLIGGLVGGVISGRYLKNVSASFLRKVLGALILWGGIRSVFL